jgi:hypothetical protein
MGPSPIELASALLDGKQRTDIKNCKALLS